MKMHCSRISELVIFWGLSASSEEGLRRTNLVDFPTKLNHGATAAPVASAAAEEPANLLQAKSMRRILTKLPPLSQAGKAQLFAFSYFPPLLQRLSGCEKHNVHICHSN